MKSNPLGCVVNLLVIVGAINWGLVGVLDYNLVTTLLGVGTNATRVVYGLVGVAGLWNLFNWVKSCKSCG